MPSLAQAIVWIIVGLLGGSLAALMITRERKGFGILRNLGIGLVGASPLEGDGFDHRSPVGGQHFSRPPLGVRGSPFR